MIIRVYAHPTGCNANDSMDFISRLQATGELPCTVDIDDALLACAAGRTAVMRIDGVIVAVFRYYLGHRHLWACGTWIRKGWRNRGLASRLWKSVLIKGGVTTVTVTTVSRNGDRLVKSLEARFPGIRWDHLSCS